MNFLRIFRHPSRFCVFHVRFALKLLNDLTYRNQNVPALGSPPLAAVTKILLKSERSFLFFTAFALFLRFSLKRFLRFALKLLRDSTYISENLIALGLPPLATANKILSQSAHRFSRKTKNDLRFTLTAISSKRMKNSRILSLTSRSAQHPAAFHRVSRNFNAPFSQKAAKSGRSTALLRITPKPLGLFCSCVLYKLYSSPCNCMSDDNSECFLLHLKL